MCCPPWFKPFGRVRPENPLWNVSSLPAAFIHIVSATAMRCNLVGATPPASRTPASQAAPPTRCHPACSPGFDLEGLRSKLDEQGLAVANAQEASVRSRKALAERTKDFRRRAAPEMSREVAPLLKAYQEEVDRLTARYACS